MPIPMRKAAKFKYPWKTTRPDELALWTDQSWGNDASASCVLPAPTGQFPKGGFRLWVQPDDKKEREFPDEPVFQLDYVHDWEEGGFDEPLGDRIVFSVDSVAKVKAHVDLELRRFLLTTPTNRQLAEAWLESAVSFFGRGFHPDTPGDDYVEGNTGKDTFTRDEAERFERARDNVFRHVKDPYAVGLKFLDRLEDEYGKADKAARADRRAAKAMKEAKP